jgi:hypothetical protein
MPKMLYRESADGTFKNARGDRPMDANAAAAGDRMRTGSGSRLDRDGGQRQ